MPRPMKWRRISFIPKNKYFAPKDIKEKELIEVQLKMEELEAMRLKDLEGLHQSECALLMNISRQTFQLIIDEARRKVTLALTSGKAINITGGYYTYKFCEYTCESCEHEFVSTYESETDKCPICKGIKLTCQDADKFCKKTCRKKCRHSSD